MATDTLQQLAENLANWRDEQRQLEAGTTVQAALTAAAKRAEMVQKAMSIVTPLLDDLHTGLSDYIIFDDDLSLHEAPGSYFDAILHLPEYDPIRITFQMSRERMWYIKEYKTYQRISSSLDDAYEIHRYSVTHYEFWPALAAAQDAVVQKAHVEAETEQMNIAANEKHLRERQQLVNCPHGIAFSGVRTRPGNIVEVEWQLPVNAPEKAQTILIVHDGTVYAGVFMPTKLWREARVIRYPEDLPSVALADCDYWAALPSRPYIPGD